MKESEKLKKQQKAREAFDQEVLERHEATVKKYKEKKERNNESEIEKVR